MAAKAIPIETLVSDTTTPSGLKDVLKKVMPVAVVEPEKVYVYDALPIPATTALSYITQTDSEIAVELNSKEKFTSLTGGQKGIVIEFINLTSFVSPKCKSSKMAKLAGGTEIATLLKDMGLVAEKGGVTKWTRLWPGLRHDCWKRRFQSTAGLSTKWPSGWPVEGKEFAYSGAIVVIKPTARAEFRGVFIAMATAAAFVFRGYFDPAKSEEDKAKIVRAYGNTSTAISIVDGQLNSTYVGTIANPGNWTSKDENVLLKHFFAFHNIKGTSFWDGKALDS